MLEGLVAPVEGLDHLMVVVDLAPQILEDLVLVMEVVVDSAPQILEDLVLVMEVAEDSAHQMEKEVLVDPVMEALEVPVVDSGTVDLEGDLGSEAAAAQKVYITVYLDHFNIIAIPLEKNRFTK